MKIIKIIKLNLKKKMESRIEKWTFLRYNIHQRILFIKAYIISMIFTIPGRYLTKMNILMYKYIWGSKREKIARKTLIRSCDKGVLGMIDLQNRRNADIIAQIINVPENLNQQCLYVYWIDFMMKIIHPRLADNTWVHTLNITPKNIFDIKQYCLKNNQTLTFGR